MPSIDFTIRQISIRLFPSLSVLIAMMLFVQRVLAAPSRPNILFIFSDDHAYQAISAYGSQLNKTPNIDRIANDGMRFDR